MSRNSARNRVSSRAASRSFSNCFRLSAYRDISGLAFRMVGHLSQVSNLPRRAVTWVSPTLPLSIRS